MVESAAASWGEGVAAGEDQEAVEVERTDWESEGVRFDSW
jgi:hypothetical protein